jgi:hypothetical protein
LKIMQGNWQHKIQQHTATPPSNVWAAIVDVLDKEKQSSNLGFAARLQNAAIPPPANTLQNIFASLDLEQATEEVTFAKRLHDYIEKPPVSAWANIAEKLDGEKAIVIPFEPRKKITRLTWVRAVAAAAVITIVAALLWPNTKKPAANEPIPVASVTPQNQPAANATPEKESVTLLTPETQENKNAAVRTTPMQKQPENAVVVGRKKVTTVATVPAQAPSYVATSATEDLAQNPANFTREKLRNVNGEIPEDVALMNTPNSYINVTGPDGQSVKVSAKFANLIGYMNADGTEVKEAIDVIISESAKWRKTFAEWKSKMINNNVAPSFTNFMDIIELSKVLEGNK